MPIVFRSSSASIPSTHMLSQIMACVQCGREDDPIDLPKTVRSKLLEFSSSSKNITEFKYENLPADRRRIRLLRLFPGVLDNPQIDCEIFLAEFDEDNRLSRIPSQDINHQTDKDEYDHDRQADEHVTYEALSWRWGDEDRGKYTIIVKQNGKLFKKRVSQTSDALEEKPYPLD